MKILITTRFIPHQPITDTGSQLARGFQELGHDVILFGNFYGQSQKFVGLDRINEKPDLWIVMECNDGQVDYSYLLNRSNLKDTPRIYWDWDSCYDLNSAFMRAMRYSPNKFLIGAKSNIDKFKQRFNKSTIFLSYACSPWFHKRLDTPKEYLLGFIGSLTAERKELLGKFPNEIFVAEGLYGEEYIKALNKCCVVFHQNQKAADEGELICGRPFEATGCGSSLLMNKKAYDDFVAILPDELRNHIFSYNNHTDISEWIEYWKDRKTDLILLGEELMNYIHNNHSYKNRAQEIIKTIL